MNDKIKRFSFGEQAYENGKRKRNMIARPELIIMSIEDRTKNKKVMRTIVISIHKRIVEKAGWQVGDKVDFVLQGEGMTEGVLTPSLNGFRLTLSSKSRVARYRLEIPSPEGDERWAEIKPAIEAKDVEQLGEKIAFTMPI